METTKVSIEIPSVLEFNGVKCQPTGAFRLAEDGEYYKELIGAELLKAFCIPDVAVFIYEEVKPWRAEVNGHYYYVDFDIKVEGGTDYYMASDDEFFESGNYFKTAEQAQLMADKFKQLLKDN
jgi:hypothetical protein